MHFGNLTDAEQLFEEGLQMIKSDVGEINIAYAISLNNYSLFQNGIVNNNEESVVLFEKAT